MNQRLKAILSVLIGCFIVLLIPIKSYSQSSDSELFNIHLNQPLYVAGETIWFKVYQTNFKSEDNNSSIIYINLHDREGNVLQQQKHKLIRGVTNGSLDIPVTYAEGYYYLTCFTRWNLQFEENQVSCIRIPILNAFQNSASVKTEHSNFRQVKPNYSDQNLQLILKKDTFSRRDMVDVEIQSKYEGIAQLSMTVHALHQFGIRTEAVNNTNYARMENSRKEKSLMIEGIIRDPVSKNPVYSDVVLFYKTGSDEFTKTRTTTGNIELSINDFIGSASYQVFDMNPFQTTIPIFESTTIGEKLFGTEEKNLFINPTVTDYLNDYRLNQKVIEIFNSSYPDSINRQSFLTIPLKPAKIYEMDKYQDLKNLEEFLREVVTFAKVRNENNQLTVKLKNRETNREFMEQPWYLVDGYLTRDEQTILSIPFKNIVRVELFNTDKSILGQLETTMIRSGLIAIYTNNNFMKSSFENQINHFNFNGFSEKKNFKVISNTIPSPGGQPVFRYQLYWNPEIEMESNYSINFQCSDLIGDYIIEVEGVTANGKYIFTSETFSVEF